MRFADNQEYRKAMSQKLAQKFFIITLLIIGIYFRFFDLDHRVYWHDEVFTSFRIAGYTREEMFSEAADGHIKSSQDFKKYQQINSERGLMKTIRDFAVEDVQHPPVYYILTRFWEQIFGNSLLARRSLPALISCLVLPCLWVLCLELFNSSLIASVVVALVAISPFHLLYAQDCRQYSFWMLTISLSSWALLRGIRLNSKWSWMLYSLSLVLLLYTHLFSILVAVGQNLYFLGIEKFKKTKKLKNFLISSLIGWIFFSPWILVIIVNYYTIQRNKVSLQANFFQDYYSYRIPLFPWLKHFAFTITRIFVDLDSNGKLLNLGNSLTPVIRGFVLIIVVSLVIYSLYIFYTQAPQSAKLLISTVFFFPGMVIILSDLVFGGSRSVNFRYLIPSYFGLQIIVAYFLATYLTLDKKRLISQLLLSFLLSVGIASCFVISQSQAWWNSYGSYDNPRIINLVNQSPKPLFISYLFLPRVLSLNYYFDPKVKILLLDQPEMPKISEQFSDIFVYNPDPQFLDRLKNIPNYRLEKVYESPDGDNFLEDGLRKTNLYKLIPIS